MSIDVLQHFDYPESWNYKGNAALSTASKFGKACLYLPDISSSVEISNSSRVFSLAADGSYEAECFVKPFAYSQDEVDEYGYVSPYWYLNGHTYRLFPATNSNNIAGIGVATSLGAAETFCESLGGHLATVTSAEEDNFLKMICSCHLVSIGANVWLGGQYNSSTRQFEWLNGDDNDYVNSLGIPLSQVLQYYRDGIMAFRLTNGGVYNRKILCEWDYEVLNTVRDPYVGFPTFEGHRFQIFKDEASTYSTLKTLCELRGGHLATSTSAEKNEFLVSLAKSAGYTNNNICIGGHRDNDDNDKWIWITGEDWDYSNWNSGEPNSSSETAVVMNGSTGLWYDVTESTSAICICEWDDIPSDTDTVMKFGDDLNLILAMDRSLSLTSETWGIEATSETTLTADTWHHVLLRISGGYAYVFVDGVQVISAEISGNTAITPEAVTLGGFIGYLDEFAFRREAGTGNPTVPTQAYEAGSGSSETVVVEKTVIQPATYAPVTRVAWSATGLPAGLTLSASGLLSGHPTVAGTYTPAVTVTTNWGSATKNIRIIVE